MENAGTCYGHLVNLLVIFVYLSHFGHTKKICQAWTELSRANFYSTYRPRTMSSCCLHFEIKRDSQTRSNALSHLEWSTTSSTYIQEQEKDVLGNLYILAYFSV
jgi:hypothetical protein